MRLYLSSFRIGDHPEYLTALAGGGGRAAVIANAMDEVADDIRRAAVQYELGALGELGFDAAELDLRRYFGRERRLRADLTGVSLAWLRGGNTFMLRYAMRRSGADLVFPALLADDALTYGGYSAGCCVLAPSLRGLEEVDDAGPVTRVYGSEPVWDGLGILDEAFVPHYDSPGHPETDAVGRVAERYRSEGIAHRTLRDGQALVISDQGTFMV